MSNIYMAWWIYLLATSVTLFAFRTSFPLSYKQILGIDFKIREFAQSLLILIATAICSEMLISFSIDDSIVQRIPGSFRSFWPVQPIFQAFNEEMIGRAAVFYFLMKWLKNKLRLSTFIALTFSLIHFIFFWLKEDVLLTPITLIVLFLAALATNLIYLKRMNVLYVWALHAGWNAQVFGAKYFFSNSIPLKDSEKFNAVLGTWPALVVSTMLLLAAFVATHRQSIIKSYQVD